MLPSLHLPARARGPLLSVALGLSASAGAQEPEEVVVQAPGTTSTEGATVLDVTQARPAEGLGDVLQRVPGATVRGLGGLGAWSGVSLRGSSFRQVEVRLDGVPINPDGVDAVNLSAWPLAALSQVRVFRGRVPASYGASPVGGLVDLITRSAAAPPRLAFAVGSYETAQASASGGWAGQLGEVPQDGFVAMDVLGTGGAFPYVSNGGTLFSTEDDATLLRTHNARYQLAGLARWRVGDVSAGGTLLDAFVHRDEELPGPIGAPAVQARLVTTRNLAVLQGQGQAGASLWHGRLWHLLRISALDDRLAEIGVGAAHQRDTAHALGGQADVDAVVLPWLALRASAQARWEQFARVRLSDLGDGVADAPASRAVAGAALDLRGAWLDGALIVVPGVDLRGVWPLTLEDQAVYAANPGLVVEGHPGRRVVIRATGGRSFRPPDLTELYGNQGALVGNAALRPESAWQGDLSLAWSTAPGADVGVALEAAGFFRAVNDRITWVQNAQRTLVPVNFGEAWVGGAEASLSVDVLGWVDAQTQGTWTEGINRSTDSAERGKQLPFVPRVQVDHALGAHWDERIAVGWTLHAMMDVYTDAANVHRQADRVLHGLYVRSRPGPRWPTLELAVHNVGDLRVQDVPRDPLGADDGTVPTALTDFVGYPLPGRTFVVGLTWTPENPR